MDLIDLCRAYGDIHDMNTLEAWENYSAGNISPYELLDAYLQNEGIIGYTQQIITAFRIVYELD